MPRKKRPAFQLLFEMIEALQRENVGMHCSLLKDTMKRKQPQFRSQATATARSPASRGCREARGFVVLKKDPRSGTYVVDGFGGQ